MRFIAILVVLLGVTAFPSSAITPFYADDARFREPETQGASGAVSRDLSLAWDILSNLFARRTPSAPTRALDVDTVDEVMDSSWFTNRAGTRPLSPADVERGPGSGVGPAGGPWTILSGKSDGAMPGLVALEIDSATAERRTPVRAYFRRDVGFWRLVGLDRGIPAATVK